MLPLVDYIILGLLVIFFHSGWKKGFWRTFLGPILLVVGSLGGYFYYQETGNLIIALLISIAGPFVINIACGLLIKVAKKAQGDEEDAPLWGRLTGGALSLAWNGSLLLLTVVLIGLLPANFPWLKRPHAAIVSSHTYNWIHNQFAKKLPSATEIENFDKVFEDPERLKDFQSTEEFQAILNHDAIKELYSDEETVKELQEKNIGKLLTNPKIQAAIKTITNDPELLKKFMSLQEKLVESPPGEKKNIPQPKVVEKRGDSWEVVR